MPPDLPRLRRTPSDPWLSTRMHHAAELGQRELALTDGFAAAMASGLARLRALVLPTPTSRPIIPDPAMAEQAFLSACAEFVQPLVGETWWSQYGQDFVANALPEVIANLQGVLAAAAADPTITVEQERAAALAVLYLGGGSAAGLTAASPEPSPWTPQWAQAWAGWDDVAKLDDQEAIARGYLRTVEQLKNTKVDMRTTEGRRIKEEIARLTKLAESNMPTAAQRAAAQRKFEAATKNLAQITPPFPGGPKPPLSVAPKGLKNYYTRAERYARSSTVSSYNLDALDRAKAETGVVLAKTWLATADERTRDTHADADGQQVGLDEQFSVGDDMLDYPGDPNGSPEETINCRCTFITDEVPAPGEAEVPAIDTPELQARFDAAERIRNDLGEGDYRPNLPGATKDEKDALASYTGRYGRPTNALLRDPAEFTRFAAASSDPGWHAPVADLMHRADLVTKLFEKSALTEDVSVARGVVATKGFDPATFKAGTFFADPAFYSTTTNLSEAVSFSAGDVGLASRGVVGQGWTIVSQVPKGTPVLPGAGYQQELLFPRGLPHEILRVDKENFIVYTKVVPK